MKLKTLNTNELIEKANSILIILGLKWEDLTDEQRSQILTELNN